MIQLLMGALLPEQLPAAIGDPAVNHLVPQALLVHNGAFRGQP